MQPKNKVGRPATEPTKVMTIPVDKIEAVAKIIKRPVPEQTPVIRIRVPLSKIEAVRKCIKKGNKP